MQKITFFKREILLSYDQFAFQQYQMVVILKRSIAGACTGTNVFNIILFLKINLSQRYVKACTDIYTTQTPLNLSPALAHIRSRTHQIYRRQANVQPLYYGDQRVNADVILHTAQPLRSCLTRQPDRVVPLTVFDSGPAGEARMFVSLRRNQ